MKFEKTAKLRNRCKTLTMLLAGLVQAIPVFANANISASYNLCSSNSLICAIHRNDGLNNVNNFDLFKSGPTHLVHTNNKKDISDLNSRSSVACTGHVQKIVSNSEWDQFVNRFNNTKFVSTLDSKYDADKSWDNYKMSDSNLENCRLGEVSVPVASWLFASALIGFVGLSNKRRV